MPQEGGDGTWTTVEGQMPLVILLPAGNEIKVRRGTVWVGVSHAHTSRGRSKSDNGKTFFSKLTPLGTLDN